MTYEQLRTEFTNPNFRKQIIDIVGSICVNCETSDNIEYHHIVPLKNGGTNKLTNIVPICKQCHCKAHNKIHRDTTKGGRPKAIELENVEHILHRYFNNEIGKKETKLLLGINPNSKGCWERITKEYKQKHNITKFYNNVDLKNSQSKRLGIIKAVG